MNLQEYDYYIPEYLIAQKAFYPRDHCRLLILNKDKYGQDQCKHKKFFEIIDYLEKGDVFVINETKVKICKLVGKKEFGSDVEVTLVKELGKNRFVARVKGKNPHKGVKLVFKNNSALIEKQDYDIFELQFEKEVKESDCELLTPPYINKKIIEDEYQTVFAKKEGSLTAPTAGLRFTPELLKEIEEKGVKIARVQSDISYATFLPIRDISNHKTGQEYFCVDKENARIINSAKENLIAVGTTVVKCLESYSWKDKKILPTCETSEIFVQSGYKFRAPIKAMLTNFHLLQSSLLLLTSAYAGRERLLGAY